LMVRETVAVETLASRATSFIFIGVLASINRTALPKRGKRTVYLAMKSYTDFDRDLETVSVRAEMSQATSTGSSFNAH
ncbi:MAG: hypothetical protein WA602_09540, partial [Silvibacterium sp.]